MTVAVTAKNKVGSAKATSAPVGPIIAAASYALGGAVTGLSGTVVLQDNGADDLSVSADGPFTFATKLAGGSTYTVTVKTNPTGQTCTVSNGSGTVTADVTNVAVTCTTRPPPPPPGSCPCVALTFDDGPSSLTPSYLSALQTGSWPATFFDVGDMMRGTGNYSQYAAAEVADGMVLGDHTITHSDLTTLPLTGPLGSPNPWNTASTDSVQWELQGQQALVANIVPGYTENLYRPPYGAYNAGVDSEASSLGLTRVMWTWSDEDLETGTADQIAAGVLSHVHDGSIILMHDNRYNQTTVDALPQIIAGLRAQGFNPGKIVPSSTPMLDVYGNPMYVQVVPF